MFDVGFSELVLLAVVALVVLGPEKLPHAARMAGAWLGRLRRTMISIQAEIEKEVADQELRQRIEQEVARLKATEVAINQEINEQVHAVERQILPPTTVTAALATTETPVTEPAPTESPTTEPSSPTITHQTTSTTPTS